MTTTTKDCSFTYVCPVQSSTWSDPWLTTTAGHSVHWVAEEISMALDRRSWHNPSNNYNYKPTTKLYRYTSQDYLSVFVF